MTEMGPLADGGRVAIIGGGPGGTGTAISLARRATRLGRQIEMLLIEPKEFGQDYNQCLGVLSPPLLQTLKRELGVILPDEMLQRRISGYTLHSDHRAVFLSTDEEVEQTYAVRRVEFDRFMLHAAELAGVTLVRDRAHDVEFDTRGATVFCDRRSHRVDVVVGAFGLEPTMAGALARRVGYRAPPCLETVVTKVHPAGLEPIPGLLEDTVHVFIPSQPGVEFGALVPKGNHVSIIVAGQGIQVRHMQAFLQQPDVGRLLPDRYDVEAYFKGTFPVGPAGRFFGDRYVAVGDAAGLVRPFKGKGIYSGVLTGARAARIMLEVGISRAAFTQYYAECAELARDVWYGRAARLLTLVLSKRLSFDPVVSLAARDPAFRRILYLAVSGHDTYRNILRGCLKPGIAAGFLADLGRHYLAGTAERPGATNVAPPRH